MSDITRQLSEFDEAYNSATTPSRTPDGHYTVTVEDASLRPNKKTGDLNLVWKLVVFGGPYNGNILWHRNRIADEISVRFLKWDLHKAGLSIKGKLSEELPQRITELLDKKLEVDYITDESGKYQNVRIQEPPKEVAPPEPPAPAAPAPAAPKKESEIPF